MGRTPLLLRSGDPVAELRCDADQWDLERRASSLISGSSSSWGGSHTLLCNNGYYKEDLSKLTDGLFFFANWDNRISSYEVFNFTGRKVTFWVNPAKGGQFVQTYNTAHEFVNNLNFSFGNFNDLFSSVLIN